MSTNFRSLFRPPGVLVLGVLVLGVLVLAAPALAAPALAAPALAAPALAAPALAAPGGEVKPGPPAQMQVLASPGTQIQATPGGADYDFGPVSGLSRTSLAHTFLLHNGGDRPLTLDHLQPSCGCTSASIVSPPGPAGPHTAGPAVSGAVVFGPHETVAVQVAVDPAMLPPGAAHKTVWVFVRGQAAPAATLVMTGTVLPAAAFDPPAVDFGGVTAGTRLTQLLNVTVDTTALPPGATWRLVSSDPDVTVAPAATSPPVPATPPAAQPFQVTLNPQAFLGAVQGDLSVMVSMPGAPDTPSGSAPLVGEVTGDITAAPAALGFGVVPAGQGTTRQTFVTGKSLAGLTAASSSPYLTVTLARVADVTPTLALTATLSPKTPAGPLDTQVVVTTPGGQRLRVPLYAIVEAAH